MGGCCSSSIAWEAEAVDGWPTYSIRRTVQTASHYTLELVPDSHALGTSTTTQGAPPVALLIEVQLFVTSNGRVHAGSLHPSEVKFTVGGVGGPLTVVFDSVPDRVRRRAR